MNDIAMKVGKVGVGMRVMRADRRLRVKITLSMNAIMVEMLNRNVILLSSISELKTLKMGRA